MTWHLQCMCNSAEDATAGARGQMSGRDVMPITHQSVALRIEVATYNIVGVSLQRSQAFPSDCVPQLQ